MVLTLATAPTNLDPRYASDAASVRVCRLLYAALVDFDPAYRPVGELADWAVLSPIHYRLGLKPTRQSFADGQPVTAADVAATYRAVLDPGRASPIRSSLRGIKAIEVLNPDTLDFHLHAPDPLFPGRLTLGVLPARVAEGPPLGLAAGAGSGPFRLERVSAASLVLQRRVDGLRVTIRALAEPLSRLQSVRTGESDLIQGDLPPEQIAWARTQPALRVMRTPGDGLSYLGFNLRHPLLGTHAFRQALSLAIDRELFSRTLGRGYARPAVGLFPSEHWAAAPLPALAHDIGQARQVLATLGIDREHPVRLQYKTSNNPERIRVGLAIKASLAPLGIELEIVSLDWGAFFNDIRAGRFEIYGLQWIGLKLPDIYRYAFHSASVPPDGANRGRLNDPQMDALIVRAEASDAGAESAAWQAVARHWATSLPQVPLWYDDSVAVLGPRIRNYRLSADGGLAGLADITLQETATTASPSPEPHGQSDHHSHP